MRFPIEGNISFRNVSFAYPQRADAPALSKLSCDILDGECVAIVGESGSGKSTIAALLQRLYEPNSGTIRIGKHRLSDADAVWLRHHISIVSQHPALFDASVADNISYGAKGVPFEEIERAARDAHLHDFIMTLPKGYDTMLGENASLISGGQAQRLQIARALLNGRASVLIFDECTSALDGANQDAVMATVMKVKDGRTSIIITHKVPVMQMCDRILVMEKGAIVEDGSYDDLMARRGRFYTLANAGVWTGE
jgi:ATP-binding cassette subfamily B (MDR/TAP) protein 1